jgi:hypothetical protein
MEQNLKELIQFLKDDSRIELKSSAIANILGKQPLSSERNIINRLIHAGLTGDKNSVEILISNFELLKTIVHLTTDASYVIAKDACFCEYWAILSMSCCCNFSKNSIFSLISG